MKPLYAPRHAPTAASKAERFRVDLDRATKLLRSHTADPAVLRLHIALVIAELDLAGADPLERVA